LTHDERADLFRKRIWDVADFAAFLGGGCSHWQAKERLQTYDRAMSGMLLIASKGANRKYTFYHSQLAKAFPALFLSLDNLGVKVDDHDDKIGELYQRDRAIGAKLRENAAEIAKLKREIAGLKRATRHAA
jgi:hypothetical protein